MKLAFGCMGDVWAFGESCKESTISGIRTWTWHINERYDSSEEASFFLKFQQDFFWFLRYWENEIIRIRIHHLLCMKQVHWCANVKLKHYLVNQ